MKLDAYKELKKDCGFALFIVLSFLMIAAAITIPFLTNARIEALVSRNTGQATHDKIMLRGVLQVAALRYLELFQQPQQRPPRSVDCSFTKFNLSFDFQDHSGLIDLNAASVDVLMLGLEGFDLSPEIATRLASNIVKYRSVDNLTAAEPAGLDVRNGYKNGLFEHVSELYDLLVAAGISIKNIDEIFTVYSGSGTIDEAAAPKRLLTAIEKRAAIDRVFIVNDTRRTNAITVSATIKSPGSPPTFAKAVFGRGQNEQGVIFLGAMNLVQMPEGGSGRDRGTAVACEVFFDPQILQALEETTS